MLGDARRYATVRDVENCFTKEEPLEAPSSFTSSCMFQPSWVNTSATRSCHHDFLLCFRPKGMGPTDLGMKLGAKTKLSFLTRIYDSNRRLMNFEGYLIAL